VSATLSSKSMIENVSHQPPVKSGKSKSHKFSAQERRRLIRIAVAPLFAATGFGATRTAALAKAAKVSEAGLFLHFGTKQKLFEEVVEDKSHIRVAALRARFSAIPKASPVECVESMAESTVLACVEDPGNAAVMAWALMELPEFATDVYRMEIGAVEALWDAELGMRFAGSPAHTPLAVRLVPYAAHACMAFGLWLVTLRHKPTTAYPHARQYAEGMAGWALSVLNGSDMRPAGALRGVVK